MSKFERREVGSLCVYNASSGVSTQLKGQTLKVSEVHTKGDDSGMLTGYTLREPYGSGTVFAYERECDDVPATAPDWEVIALQHARQRDEAMAQRDSNSAALSDMTKSRDWARAELERRDRNRGALLKEHREALDARDDELLALRSQRDELAVLYGKARLDADKAQRKLLAIEAIAGRADTSPGLER
jgi:hypothetical protein